eukprot:403362047
MEQVHQGNPKITIKKDQIINEIQGKLASFSPNNKANKYESIKNNYSTLENQKSRSTLKNDLHTIQSQPRFTTPLQSQSKIIYDLKFDRIRNMNNLKQDQSLAHFGINEQNSLTRNKQSFKQNHTMDAQNIKSKAHIGLNNSSFVSLPPYALYNPQSNFSKNYDTSQKTTRNPKILLNLSRERLTKKFYDKDIRQPYMDANIDLSFPEIKSQVKLDQAVDSQQLQDELLTTRKAQQFQAEKNVLKIQNKQMKEQDIIDNYQSKVSLAKFDVKRNVQISLDNTLMNEDDITNKSTQLQSRNKSYIPPYQFQSNPNMTLSKETSNNSTNFQSSKKLIRGLYSDPFSDQLTLNNFASHTGRNVTNLNDESQQQYNIFNHYTDINIDGSTNNQYSQYSEGKQSSRLDEAKTNFLRRKNDYIQRKQFKNNYDKIIKENPELINQERDKIVQLLKQAQTQFIGSERKIKASVNKTGLEKQIESRIQL